MTPIQTLYIFVNWIPNVVKRTLQLNISKLTVDIPYGEISAVFLYLKFKGILG